MKGDHPRRPEIRFMDPGFHRDPGEAYSWLRRHAPVYWDDAAPGWDARGAWGVSRYADIRTVSLDQETFSSERGSRPDAPPVPSMINFDEPAHMARRGVVRQRFTPQSVRALEPFVRQAAHDLIDRVEGRGACDFVADLARPLPMMVIGELLGVPRGDHEQLLEWSDLIASGNANMPEGFADRMRAAVEAFGAYIGRWFELRSREPGDDLLSALVQARVLGTPLSSREMMQEALLLLVGGDETTRHVLTGGVEALLRHGYPIDALDELDIGSAIEEMLRWVTPVKLIARTATRAVDLGGQRIEAGDRLLLLYESGNRDEVMFEAPERFDPGRTPNHHLTFGGFGRHYCLGANLARLEIRIMLEALAERLPGLRLATDAPLPKRWGTFVLGLESMPVRY